MIVGDKPKAPIVTVTSVVPASPSLQSLNDHNLTSVVIDNAYKNGAVIADQNPSPEVKFLTPDSNTTSITLIEKKYSIPDGGWGWFVVLASLVICLVADGVSFSFGLLLSKFQDAFGSSYTATSWIGSLFMATPLLSGPIMSALVDKYGCRSMTILGGVISTVGFLLSSLSESLYVMYLTFGFLAGLGLGLCFVTSVVAIAFWFEKKRNLAVALGACGTGIGTFVFAPLTTTLLGTYGWRGTVIMLAGTFLNMCVCGALMRDPDWIKEQDRQNAKLTKSSKSSSTSTSASNVSHDVVLRKIKKLLESGKDAEYILQNLVATVEAEKSEVRGLQKGYSSAVSLPTFIKQQEKVPYEVLEHLISNKRLYNLIVENYPSLLLCRSTSEKGLHKIPDEESNVLCARIPVKLSLKLKKAEKSKPKLQQQLSMPDGGRNAEDPLLYKRQHSSSKENSPWLMRHFQFNPNHAYFRNMKLHRLSMVHHGTALNVHKYRLKASSCPNIYRVSMTTLAKDEDNEKWYTEIVEVVKGMMDYTLFLELHFFILSLSTIVLFIWFIVPYFYLVDYMKDNGYSEKEASFLLSAIGVANTIGMVGLGWAGDQPWMNVWKTCGGCLIICGLSLVMMVVSVHNYILMVVTAAVFGLTLASSFAFTPIMMVKLVPLERFTTAYGLNLLCQGIGNLVGPPLAGSLRDLTHNLRQSFYQGAVWIAVSGLLILIIPFTKNRKIIGSGPVEMDLVEEDDE